MSPKHNNQSDFWKCLFVYRVYSVIPRLDDTLMGYIIFFLIE